MEKSILILIMLAVAATAGYFMFRIDAEKTGEHIASQYATFSSSELGVAFKYRTGPSGYVLQESTPTDTENGLVRALVLVRTEDVARGMPVGGEGPATMSVQVFTNTKKQQSRAWADAHVQYSNINLKIGDVSEAVVGGAKAVRYMTDGLYRADTVVVAHGGYVYELSGAFLDENSDLRRDFQPLLDSVTFIPQVKQE